MHARRLAALACVPLALAAQGAPVTHRVTADTFWNTLDHRHPVLRRIKPGDIVITKTIDASGYDEHDVRRALTGNPMTGPFYVEGAEPGDAIAVHFRKVRLNRTTAWGYYRLGAYSLTGDALENSYPNRFKPDLVRPGRVNLVPWELDTAKNVIRLKEPVSAVMKMEFPAEPMLGVVGVAPAGDFAPTSAPSDNYGGNMDFNEVREGATLYLPVFHPGAYLFLADGHALMADGEPTGAGVETSMDVEFSTELVKKANLTMPRLENRDYIITIGSQREFASTLDRGLQLATSDMVRWLTERYKLEPWAAHLLINAQAQYEVVTVMGSMALKIPKKYLP